MAAPLTRPIEALAIASNGSPDSFLKGVRSTSKKYRRKAKQARHQYVGVGLCTIAFSSLLPVAAVTPVPRWVVAGLGAVVIIGQGFLALTRPHERALHYERAGNVLSLEIDKYEYCSAWKCKDQDQAWVQFVTKVLALENRFFQQEIEINGPGVITVSAQQETPSITRR
jgi:Protein of unknown function (DUF4231)